MLAHGLWLNRHALFAWRNQFGRRGVKAVSFGYPSREPLIDNSRRLAALIQSLDEQNIYVLGHSLGGLLVLHLLANPGPVSSAPRIRRVVLAGTPAGGSEAARRLARWRGGRWLIAGAEPVLDPSAFARPRIYDMPAEIGVIAGTRAIGLGRLFGPLPGPNDGTVTVAETRFAGVADAITLPVSHSEMLLSGRVVAQAYTFFAGGQFDHGEDYARFGK